MIRTVRSVTSVLRGIGGSAAGIKSRTGQFRVTSSAPCPTRPVRTMVRAAGGADPGRMVVDVLGALLFLVSFMLAWTTVGAVQARRLPPAE